MVDLAFLARAFERTALAAAEVIVVGADKHVFRARRLARGRDQGHDIVVMLSNLLHSRRNFHSRLRDGETALRALRRSAMRIISLSSPGGEGRGEEAFSIRYLRGLRSRLILGVGR